MRIMNDYADCERKPEINVTDSSFMITLPNMRNDKPIQVQVNEQEQEVMNDLHQTIISYVMEYCVRFIAGDLSIDRDWDKYVAEFNKMGLADVIRVTQSCWDRMNRNNND